MKINHKNFVHIVSVYTYYLIHSSQQIKYFYGEAFLVKMITDLCEAMQYKIKYFR